MRTSDPDAIWPVIEANPDPLEKRAIIMIYAGGLTQAQVARRLGWQRIEIAVAFARALRVVADAVETSADNGQPTVPMAAG